jgi:hypothetical protein
LSGASQRKFAILKKKSPLELTEEEKKFVEYAEDKMKSRKEYSKMLSMP